MGANRAGLAVVAVVLLAAATPAVAAVGEPETNVLRGWYGMSLSLTRHTATFSPPVASRAYGYIGVAAYEAIASGSDRLRSLAGQLNGLAPLPPRQAGQAYDDAVVLDAALSTTIQALFSNTGPTGHRAMDALEAKLRAEAGSGIAPDVVARSASYGEAIARRILDWAQKDGGAVVTNMGFPLQYTPKVGAQYWVPTSTIIQQQAPLLPDWGSNRPFAMPEGASCATPAPPTYSEDPVSEYYAQALELDNFWKNMTPRMQAIARFWADDAMLSVTPPGHWLSIALQVSDRENLPIDRRVDLLMRLGVVEADAFIGCWQTKFVYDAVRPITYIRKVIDPSFDTTVTTPPFPEFTSGHSALSAAAAAVLTAAFGENYAFDDDTDAADGLEPRSFPSFTAAAEEAGISRMYAGIHYRAAVEMGAAQGRCVAAYAIALKTWR